MIDLTTDSMDKIKQSYYNLLMIASSVRQYWTSKVAVESFLNILRENDGIENDLIYQVKEKFELQTMAVKGYIIIQTCCFLDEYKLIFSLKPTDSSNDAEVNNFKNGLKKILRHPVSFINRSWKELYEVRNNLLAHNWRKNGEPIMFSHLISKPQNAPWIDEEFTLLVGIFDSVIEILKKYRLDFFNEMHTQMQAKVNETVHHMARSISHETSIEMVLEIKSLMANELKELNS